MLKITNFMVNCEYCNKQFNPTNSRQKCCSRNCTKYAWNKRKEYDSVKVTREWRLNNSEKVKSNNFLYLELNKDKIIQNRKKDYLLNKDKYRARRVKWAKNNKDKIAQINKIWKTDNKHAITERAYDRYQNDFFFRLKIVLRSRLRQAIKNNLKTGSAVRDLGCSIEEFKLYLESKFIEGMSWDNWGKNGWHIDHIIPISSFDLTDRDELLKACHYTNLQPLWAKDNLKKGNKYE